MRRASSGLMQHWRLRRARKRRPKRQLKHQQQRQLELRKRKPAGLLMSRRLTIPKLHVTVRCRSRLRRRKSPVWLAWVPRSSPLRRRSSRPVSLRRRSPTGRAPCLALCSNCVPRRPCTRRRRCAPNFPHHRLHAKRRRRRVGGRCTLRVVSRRARASRANQHTGLRGAHPQSSAQFDYRRCANASSRTWILPSCAAVALFLLLPPRRKRFSPSTHVSLRVAVRMASTPPSPRYGTIRRDRSRASRSDRL
mmetsp:Transcript_53421/g.73244  ORF Transcript_53421/g.73244 Transcript_53421/m.73244 type:complete len:250 (-) Transcript_53421:813-1562(-)